eukprot:scaffold12631_cov22-Tisochrysis_lutea.AAC.3
MQCWLDDFGSDPKRIRPFYCSAEATRGDWLRAYWLGQPPSSIVHSNRAAMLCVISRAAMFCSNHSNVKPLKRLTLTYFPAIVNPFHHPFPFFSGSGATLHVPEVWDDGAGAGNHALYADQRVNVFGVQISDSARPVQVVHLDLQEASPAGAAAAAAAAAAALEDGKTPAGSSSSSSSSSSSASSECKNTCRQHQQSTCAWAPARGSRSATST